MMELFKYLSFENINPLPRRQGKDDFDDFSYFRSDLRLPVEGRWSTTFPPPSEKVVVYVVHPKSNWKKWIKRERLHLEG